ncbi:hypothetical protein KC338_g32 [Hortaea werneckii]|nr:hypothetical protein KC338_g32 [Hortaea werneckii]
MVANIPRLPKRIQWSSIRALFFLAQRGGNAGWQTASRKPDGEQHDASLALHLSRSLLLFQLRHPRALERGVNRNGITLLSTSRHNPTNPLPLPPTPTTRGLLPHTPLLLGVEDEGQDIEPKLRELETHALELLLGLVAQDMGARGPEGGDGFPDGLVLGRRLLVHEASVGDLALGGGLGEVDLLVGEGGEGGEVEALGEGVDAGVAEEGDAVVVRGRHRGVVFHGLRALQRREVVAFVEVLEHAGGGVQVVVGELDASGLGGEGLVDGEGGGIAAVADDELDDGRAQVAFGRRGQLTVVWDGECDRVALTRGK